MAVDVLDRSTTTVPPPLLGALVRRFDPVRVVLSGSRARGEAGPESDRDPVVVVDGDWPPERRPARAAFEAIAGRGIAAGVVPVRVSTFEDRPDVVNSPPWFAATDGVVVHERDGSCEARRGP